MQLDVHRSIQKAEAKTVLKKTDFDWQLNPFSSADSFQLIVLNLDGSQISMPVFSVFCFVFVFFLINKFDKDLEVMHSKQIRSRRAKLLVTKQCNNR
jgi:hypothetical protein